MSQPNRTFANSVFPIRRTFKMEIDDLEVMEKAGHWASLRIGMFVYDLQLQTQEINDPMGSYLTSSVWMSKNMSHADYVRQTKFEFRLRILNVNKGADYVMNWTECNDTVRTENVLNRMLEWGSLRNDGFINNEKMMLEWEINITTVNSSIPYIFKTYLSEETMRVCQIWSPMSFQNGINVDYEKRKTTDDDVIMHSYQSYRAKDFQFNCNFSLPPCTPLDDYPYGFLDFDSYRTGQTEIHVEATIFYQNLEFRRSFTVEAGRHLIKFICTTTKNNSDSEKNRKLCYEFRIYRLETRFENQQPNRELGEWKHFKDIFHNCHFAKNILFSHSKELSENHNNYYVSGGGMFRLRTESNKQCFDLEKIFDFKDLSRLEIEQSFKNFILLIHGCDFELTESNVLHLLRIASRMYSIEGLVICDDRMTKMNITDDLKIMKLVDKYQLPRMIAYYVKKFEDNATFREMMQHEDFFDQLKPKFLKRIAKYQQNDVESEEDLSYESIDAVPEYTDKMDEVIFLDIKTGAKFTVSKQILANASEYFFQRFSGPHSLSEDKVVVFDDGIPEHFETFLNHLYHPTNLITSHNFQPLLVLAYRFGADMLVNKLEEFLVLYENLNVVEKMTYASKYNLTFVLESCLNSVKCLDDLERLKREEQFCELPEEFKEFTMSNIRWRILNFY